MRCVSWADIGSKPSSATDVLKIEIPYRHTRKTGHNSEPQGDVSLYNKWGKQGFGLKENNQLISRGSTGFLYKSEATSGRAIIPFSSFLKKISSPHTNWSKRINVCFDLYWCFADCLLHVSYWDNWLAKGGHLWTTKLSISFFLSFWLTDEMASPIV